MQMQFPYEQPFQPFRHAPNPSSPLPPSALKRRGSDYFQDFRNVASPNPSVFQPNGLPQSLPMSYGNGPRSPNSPRFPSSSPFQGQSSDFPFQSSTLRRRQSLPIRPESNSYNSGSHWFEDPMGYNSQSPLYSWNNGIGSGNGNGIGNRNRNRSSTVSFSPDTYNMPSRNQNPTMSPSGYSDTFLQNSNYPSSYRQSPSPHPTLFSPNHYDEYGPSTIERPLRTSVQFQQTFELHTYLSIPPFAYSFLSKPEYITRQGFNGLHQYATRPPTSVVILQSPLLPWTITIGGNSPDDKYLTVSEVLTAIYETLRESPTISEINILYSSSDSKKKYNEVIDAYERRCKREDPYNQDYIRKLDWLGGKTVFNGLVSRKNSGGDGRKRRDKPTWTVLFRNTDFH